MAENRTAGRSFLRVAYAALSALIVMAAILPLDPGPRRWPGPDLVLCLSLVWVVRRPSVVPTLLVALVLLAQDLITMRPPGLGAAAGLLAVEFLRARVDDLRTVTFTREWLSAAMVILASVLGVRLVTWLAALPQPPLSLDLVGAAATLLAYPVLVFLSASLFHLHKLTPAEIAGQVRVS